MAQQALLRSKSKLERELVKFEAVVASQVHDAESSESDSNEVEPDAAAGRYGCASMVFICMLNDCCSCAAVGRSQDQQLATAGDGAHP